jgi:hypothetical protein
MGQLVRYDEMFNRFKLVAEQKTGGVDDEEIIALVTCGVGADESAVSWKLLDVQVVCGTMGLPTATVKMVGPDAITRVNSTVGSGPVDAVYKAGRCTSCVQCVTPSLQYSRASNSSYCFVRFTSLPDIA